MKLTYHPFELSLRHAWRIASRLDGPGTSTFAVVFIELRDADGRIGRGESAPSLRYGEDVASVQQFLSRVDPARLSFDDVEAGMAYLDQLDPGAAAAKCALNIALLDGHAAGRRLPIHDLLGLGFSENRHVTSFSIGIAEPGDIRRKVEEARNYPVLKLKLGSDDDELNLAALRAAAPGVPVRVDANEAWKSREEALKRIEWLSRDPLVEFVEQPMPANSRPEDLAWLKQRSPLPLFADENCVHAADVPLCTDCFHGVNVKLVKTGGISGAFDTLRAARKAGLKTMIGCMIESSILISAAAHLAELTDHLDIDGNLLVRNDPYAGVTAENGRVSFQQAPAPFGLRVAPRDPAS